MVVDLGDLSMIADKTFSIAVTHDSVPKHSPDLETFFKRELPEKLRVTDRAAYIYPLAMYKQVQEEVERGTRGSYRTRGKWYVDDLQVQRALYNEPEVLARIKAVSAQAGFSLAIEHASEMLIVPHEISVRKLDRQKQKDAMLAVFTRL